MIKNAINKIYAAKIAVEVCSDEICKASVIARLNYLNDNQFEIVLANLNAAKSYLCYIDKVTQGPNITRVRVYFIFKDIILGSSTSGYADVPINQASDINKLFQVMGFNYISTIDTPEGKRYFATKPAVGGYKISLTIGNSGSSYVTPGGSIVTPGGSIVTPGGSVPGSTSPGSTEGFLSKAALAVAAYFLFK